MGLFVDANPLKHTHNTSAASCTQAACFSQRCRDKEAACVSGLWRFLAASSHCKADQTPTTSILMVLCPCLSSLVVGHQCCGGHSGDGRGSWFDLGPAGGPLTAPQHLQLTEGRQQPAQHPDKPPAAPPASYPSGHTHLLWLWGRAWEGGEAGHSKGKYPSSALITAARKIQTVSKPVARILLQGRRYCWEQNIPLRGERDSESAKHAHIPWCTSPAHVNPFPPRLLTSLSCAKQWCTGFQRAF